MFHYLKEAARPLNKVRVRNECGDIRGVLGGEAVNCCVLHSNVFSIDPVLDEDVGLLNGPVDGNLASHLYLVAAFSEVYGPFFFGHRELVHVDAVHAGDPILGVVLDIMKECLKRLKGKLQGGERGLLEGGEVLEFTDGGGANQVADTIASIDEEGGNEVEPWGSFLHEVGGQDGPDSVDGNRVVDVHGNGWVGFGLGEGLGGAEVVRDREFRRVATRDDEPGGVDGGEGHGGRSQGQ